MIGKSSHFTFAFSVGTEVFLGWNHDVDKQCP